MPVKQYNYNYYQSGDFMVVSFIGLQGVPQDCIVVDIQPRALHVIIKTPQFDAFDKTISLFNEVDPSTSTYQHFPSKVEIRLHKKDPMNWPSLDTASTTVLPAPKAASTTSGGLAFSTKRWDEYCEENKEPIDTTGDNLFKVLFKDANPDQKRAMLKSIQQSHGKVLNMNWNEVKDNSYDEAKKD